MTDTPNPGVPSPWPTVLQGGSGARPADGLTVVDLSRLVAGNMTSLQLADFGATVVKVEPAGSGDPLRAWQAQGQSTFWKVYGRNKQSVALDFRKDGASDILRRLIAQADVLIESFRPGVLESMGLAPDALLAAHPRLVILRVSGFGQTGPYSARPGFGTLVESMSGFAQRNGEEDGDPLLPPLALADMISGLYGAMAVMMALRARDRDGTGQVIDLSLLDSMVSVLGPEALDYQLTGTPKPRVGNGSNTSSPRNVYRTKDGQFVALSASIQSMAERLFRVMGRTDLIDDPRYATNAARVARRHEVDGIVAAWIGQFDRDDVLAVFAREGITAAPLHSIADIHADPHFIERGIYVKAPDPDLGQVAMHAPVPRLSRTPGAVTRPAPALGADTHAVLRAIGCAEAEIAGWLTTGLVKADTPA